MKTQPKARAKSSQQEQPKDDELVKASDFESLQITLSVFNTTTKTRTKRGGESHLVELGEREMILEVPLRTCAKGHNLLIDLICTRPGKEKLTLSVTCKVDEIEHIEGERVDRIALSLVQYDEREWESFCAGFDSRQKEIEEFFKAARGI